MSTNVFLFIMFAPPTLLSRLFSGLFGSPLNQVPPLIAKTKQHSSHRAFCSPAAIPVDIDVAFRRDGKISLLSFGWHFFIILMLSLVRQPPPQPQLFQRSGEKTRKLNQSELGRMMLFLTGFVSLSPRKGCFRLLTLMMAVTLV